MLEISNLQHTKIHIPFKRTENAKLNKILTRLYFQTSPLLIRKLGEIPEFGFNAKIRTEIEFRPPPYGQSH